MHETLAEFVKGKLGVLTPLSGQRLASELSCVADEMLGERKVPVPLETAQRLNGVIYLISRLGPGGHDIVERLWRDRREEVLTTSPEAFVTLISGISALGLMSLECGYLALAWDREDVLQALVGWHLIYYGDREKPADLNFGREWLLYGSERTWDRTRTALQQCMQSRVERETFLFGFYALAYVSCAAFLSQEELPAAVSFVRARLAERNFTAGRRNAVENMLNGVERHPLNVGGT